MIPPDTNLSQGFGKLKNTFVFHRSYSFINTSFNWWPLETLRILSSSFDICWLWLLFGVLVSRMKLLASRSFWSWPLHSSTMVNPGYIAECLFLQFISKQWAIYINIKFPVVFCNLSQCICAKLENNHFPCTLKKRYCIFLKIQISYPSGFQFCGSFPHFS